MLGHRAGYKKNIAIYNARAEAFIKIDNKNFLTNVLASPVLKNKR